MKFHYALLAAGGAALAPTVSMAQLSANVGYMSDYIFRGVFQEDSSAMGGLDYAHDSGFYIGTWAADVGDGLETDLYFGYGGEAGDLSYSIGYTGYFYTDDFDSEYNEVNLGVGWMGLSLDVAVGSWDGFVGSPATEDDYTHYALGYEYEGFYIKFGGWDFDKAPSTADYAEIGYGFTWQEIDFSLAIVNSSDLFVSEDTIADNAITFSISKSIAIGE
jgi:uncharacterized protein (TIGR02001 family)